MDVEPAWSADGEDLYFVTGRNRNLDIYRVHVSDGSVHPVIDGRGNQIQPAVSPDGSRIAFVAPVRGRQGSGGIYVQPLPSGEPILVLDEETAYRAKPTWTPDGASLLFVTDFSGSNDLAIVPVGGGSPLRLTTRLVDEYAPVASPDGSTIAFVANDDGPTRLMTIPAGGGPQISWSEVLVSGRRHATPTSTGVLRGRVLDASGAPVSARISLVASDGRAYTPEGGFHRVISGTETHYFHTPGEFALELPAGPVVVEAFDRRAYPPIRGGVPRLLRPCRDAGCE